MNTSLENDKLVWHTMQSISRGDACESRLTPEVLQIEGFSSPKVRHFLNNLCSFEGCRYLEIGCWKGSTLIAALYENNPYYWAVENWSQFEGPQQEFLANFNRHLQRHPSILNRHAFQFDPIQRGIHGVNVYFYDGAHTPAAQVLALSHYLPSMADTFVLVVDDWLNHEASHIPAVTQETIQMLGLKVLFKQILPGTHNSVTDWWCGLGVFVLQKP